MTDYMRISTNEFAKIAARLYQLRQEKEALSMPWTVLILPDGVTILCDELQFSEHLNWQKIIGLPCPDQEFHFEQPVIAVPEGLDELLKFQPMLIAILKAIGSDWTATIGTDGATLEKQQMTILVPWSMMEIFEIPYFTRLSLLPKIKALLIEAKNQLPTFSWQAVLFAEQLFLSRITHVDEKNCHQCPERQLTWQDLSRETLRPCMVAVPGFVEYTVTLCKDFTRLDQYQQFEALIKKMLNILGHDFWSVQLFNDHLLFSRVVTVKKTSDEIIPPDIVSIQLPWSMLPEMEKPIN